MYLDRQLLKSTQLLGQWFKGRYSNMSENPVKNATQIKSNFQIPVYLNYPQLFKVQIVEYSVFAHCFGNGILLRRPFDFKPSL